MEEEKRIQEAKNCNDCLGWHKYCNAECCRYVTLGIDASRLNCPGNFVKVKLFRILSPSEIWYYSLRDIKHSHGVLRIKKDRIVSVDGMLMYKYDCKKLKDNLCIGHPNQKPEICRNFTIDTCKDKRCTLTKNCLFRYKLKGGGFNGEKN